MEWTYRKEDAAMTPEEISELDYITGLCDKGFEHVARELRQVGEGSNAYVYAKDRFAVKVGIDFDRYIETEDIDKAHKPLPDGAFMRRFEGKIPMPRLYAYADGVIIMEYVEDPLLMEMLEEESDDMLEGAFYEMFAKVFVEERVLLLDYHESNVFVNESNFSMTLIDFGEYKEFGEDEEEQYQTLLAELREVGAHTFFCRSERMAG